MPTSVDTRMVLETRSAAKIAQTQGGSRNPEPMSSIPTEGNKKQGWAVRTPDGANLPRRIDSKEKKHIKTSPSGENSIAGFSLGRSASQLKGGKELRCVHSQQSTSTLPKEKVLRQKTILPSAGIVRVGEGKGGRPAKNHSGSKKKVREASTVNALEMFDKGGSQFLSPGRKAGTALQIGGREIILERKARGVENKEEVTGVKSARKHIHTEICPLMNVAEIRQDSIDKSGESRDQKKKESCTKANTAGLQLKQFGRGKKKKEQTNKNFAWGRGYRDNGKVHGTVASGKKKRRKTPAFQAVREGG